MSINDYFYENSNFGHKRFIIEGPDFTNLFKDNNVKLKDDKGNDIYYSLKNNESERDLILKVQNARNNILNKFYNDTITNNIDRRTRKMFTDLTDTFFTLKKCKNLNFKNNVDNPTYSASLFCPHEYSNKNSMTGWYSRYFIYLLQQLYHVKFFLPNCNVRIYLEKSLCEHLVKEDRNSEYFIYTKQNLHNEKMNFYNFNNDEVVLV